jgi:hypothetical protein
MQARTAYRNKPVQEKLKTLRAGESCCKLSHSGGSVLADCWRGWWVGRRIDLADTGARCCKLSQSGTCEPGEVCQSLNLLQSDGSGSAVLGRCGKLLHCRVCGAGRRSQRCKLCHSRASNGPGRIQKHSRALGASPQRALHTVAGVARCLCLCIFQRVRHSATLRNLRSGSYLRTPLRVAIATFCAGRVASVP